MRDNLTWSVDFRHLAPFRSKDAFPCSWRGQAERRARAELGYAEEALKEAGGKITEAWEVLGYNDRFVFSRRIRRLLERHPAVARDFPYVEALFRSTSQR